MWRIATGKVGGWVVTARPTTSQLSAASSPSRCRRLLRLLRLSSGSARQVAPPEHEKVPSKLHPIQLAEEDGCLVAEQGCALEGS